MPHSLLTPPTEEPITLAQAKQWMKVDYSDDDEIIELLISAARRYVEAETRRLLPTQVWRLTRTQWPLWYRFAVPLCPVNGISAVQVRDAAGVFQSVSPALLALENGGGGGFIHIIGQVPTPALNMPGGIQIDLNCGYGDAADVPEPLRHAILMLVAYWYEHRAATETETTRTKRFDSLMLSGLVPDSVPALIAPFKVYRL